MSMTREEIEAHIRKAEKDIVNMDAFVKAIADKWEEDVETAREHTDADACNGPCCGGQINTYNGQY